MTFLSYLDPLNSPLIGDRFILALLRFQWVGFRADATLTRSQLNHHGVTEDTELENR